MLRTDTANFNRFLTSVGMLLLAAALVVPYFYFRSTDTLETPASRLDGMTPTGRDALLDRQHAIVSLEVWVVAAAIALALVGAVLVVWGGFRLRAAQESDDEEAALRKKRAELEVEEMTPDEKAEQASEKARTEVAQEVTAGGSAPRETEEAGGSEAGPVQRAALDSWQNRIREINRISTRIEEIFSKTDILGHDLKWQVRIGSASDSVRLDGVFESTGGQVRDVVLETRVSVEPRSLRKNARNIANDLIGKLARYQAITGRPCEGWLVVVVPDESESALMPDGHGRAMDSLRSAMGSFGDVSLTYERDLESLPGRFIELFGSA